MLKVMWPEGEPDKAVCPDGWLAPFGRFGYALGWGLHGKRSRYAWPVSATDVPIVVARRCERQIRGNR